jgi:hypothetical protein
MAWEESITDPKEREVFAALAHAEWDFRTVSGIARDTKLPEADVLSVLNRYPDLIRKSYVPDRSGRDLYTLKNRPATLQERLSLIRAILAKSVR